jgi:adenylate kinase family enzyme
MPHLCHRLIRSRKEHVFPVPRILAQSNLRFARQGCALAAGWRERSRQEQRERLRDLAAGEAWVIDGSGSSSFDIRLPRTDLIIWLRLSRWKCLLGVGKRVARYKGTVRPDMAEGCPEPLPDREFLSYIWNFERRYVPRIIQEIDRHGATIPVITLKSHGEMAHLLDLAGLPH